MAVYEQLVATVRQYQTAKLQSQNKPVPKNEFDWTAFDMKKLLEEVGELAELFILYNNRPYYNYPELRGEIADVAIVLACIASRIGIEISPAMDEKLEVLKQRLVEMGHTCKEAT